MSKRVPKHERRKQHKLDAPKKQERGDERALNAYIEFRDAVGVEAVQNMYVREHLAEGFASLSAANQAKLESMVDRGCELDKQNHGAIAARGTCLVGSCRISPPITSCFYCGTACCQECFHVIPEVGDVCGNCLVDYGLDSMTSDEEPLLVAVELWELTPCRCDSSIDCRELTVPGERHPRCFECAKPRYPLPSPPSVNSGTLQSTVAPVS